MWAANASGFSFRGINFSLPENISVSFEPALESSQMYFREKKDQQSFAETLLQQIKAYDKNAYSLDFNTATIIYADETKLKNYSNEDRSLYF